MPGTENEAWLGMARYGTARPGVARPGMGSKDNRITHTQGKTVLQKTHTEAIIKKHVKKR